MMKLASCQRKSAFDLTENLSMLDLPEDKQNSSAVLKGHFDQPVIRILQTLNIDPWKTGKLGSA